MTGLWLYTWNVHMYNCIRVRQAPAVEERETGLLNNGYHWCDKEPLKLIGQEC